MPTYQYACTACGHQLEAVQSFADDPLTQCPECTGRLRKLFGSVGVVFKGSGFYRTDSRAAANGNGANGNGRKSKDGEKSTDSGATSSDKPSDTSSGSKAPVATAATGSTSSTGSTGS